MNLLRFVPIKLTLLLVLGILLGRYLQPDVFLPVTFAVLFLVLLGFLFYRDKRATPFTTHGKNSILFGILVVLTTISIGILAVSSTYPKNQPGHYSHKDVTGSHLWKIKIHEVLKSSTYSDRYVAKVLALENEKASGRLLLSFPLDSLAEKLEADDELIVYTELSVINPPLNPHQFDYQNYLEGLGISNQMRLHGNDFLTTQNPERTMYGMAARFRNQIITNLKKAHFGKEELGIIQALLLGQRNEISEETYDSYKNAGAVHILAVSGLHIGIILLLLQFLLRPLERLPKGKTIKLILIVGLLWGFALLAGLSASVVRAVTMFSFVAYALYLNRPGNTFNILALSMFFILLIIDPLLIVQVGFQMSYAAVFAIVWMYPLLERLWHPKNRIIRYFWQLLSVSIAAQLGVLPISLFYFHQFPGLFFISNLLIVPALGLILGMGILVIFLALLNSLPDILVTAYDTLIRWMNAIIGWISQQEDFVFRNISFDAVQLVLAYAILTCAVFFFSKPTFKKAIALSMAVIGFQLYLFGTSYETGQKETLFLAHQTKNSVLIHQTGNRLAVMAPDVRRLERLTTAYQIAERITSTEHRPLRNGYRWHDKNLLIIDSLGVYPKKNTYSDYVLLTGSPKLNLKRLIDSIRPETIIADGSNYRSYIERWRKTCEEKKQRFYFTGEDGAYYFD
ncbi:ComEC/Rec2 family competence protein [Pricia sp.]|uniref:ComEC/Rec2 family competence protein n=1 Tax=Pricia sp. TaxID=2268138 RepID=UPI003593B105